jgi:probable rRNA maturation factor
MIEFHSIEVDFHVEFQNDLREWLQSTANSESHTIGAINLILCSDEHLLGINQQFLNHDYYTDIITFDTSEGNIISGDLYISIDRVTENAASLHLELTDELHRVMVHGVLHLCGYTDKSEVEQTEMRSKEDHYLSLRAFP